MREHLVNGWRQQGFAPQYKPELLARPDLAEELVYLWNFFEQFSMKRVYSQYGPQQIGWTELNNWMQVFDLRLKQWEIDALLKIDFEYYRVWFEKK